MISVRIFARLPMCESDIVSVMSGAQLALLPFLIFVLPVVAASAWWLKRRYTAAVVRLQAEELFRDHGAEQRSSDRRLDHAPAPALQVRIQSAESVVPALDAVDAAVGPRRLRRRVLLIHSASELVYMCALALVMAGAAAGWDALAVLGDLARAFVPFVLVPVAIAWMLQAGVPRTVMSVVSVAVVIVPSVSSRLTSTPGSRTTTVSPSAMRRSP